MCILFGRIECVGATKTSLKAFETTRYVWECVVVEFGHGLLICAQQLGLRQKLLCQLACASDFQRNGVCQYELDYDQHEQV